MVPKIVNNSNFMPLAILLPTRANTKHILSKNIASNKPCLRTGTKATGISAVSLSHTLAGQTIIKSQE
jgi:hypothetical protein